MSELEQVEQAIAALESQRARLGASVVETALGPLRERLAALQGQATAQGQRKLVTVLTADVSGFTALAERLDAEEVHGAMNRLWAALDQAITQHGGTIDKHVGDGLVALFGAPVAHEDDPLRAARAALAMQRTLAALRREAPAPESPLAQLRLRVGIHTGPALVGALGSRAEYTAVGDTLYVASALEAAAPPDGVLLSLDCYRHIREHVEVDKQPPLSMGARSEPLITFLLLGELQGESDSWFQTGDVAPPVLVGRDTLLAELLALGERAFSERRSYAVTLLGEAGIGKSALLLALRTALLARPLTLTVLAAQASDAASRQPYALLRALLSHRLAIRSDHSADAVRTRLAHALTPLGEGEGALLAVGRLLGFRIGPEAEGTGPSPLLARQQHEQAMRLLHRLFGEWAARGPLLLLVDDLHGADDASLTFLAGLSQTLQSAPLFSVGTTRTRTAEPWGSPLPRHSLIRVEPLTQEASHQLLREQLHAAAIRLPHTLVEQLVARAEGNPHYLEALIGVVREEAAQREGRWQLAPGEMADLLLPPTLTGVLQARLDALPRPERELLQRASVAGRVFWTEWLQSLEGGPASESVLATVRALQGRGLVRPRANSLFEGTSESEFRQSLLRDVAYQGLLRSLRRRYHAQAAEWLAQQGGERADEHAALIGEHWALADEPTQAAHWFGRAARQARAAYATDSAIELYERALGLLPPAPRGGEALALHQGLAEALWLRGESEEALSHYQTMAALAEPLGDEAAQARAWYSMALVQSNQGHERAALASAQRAERHARAADAPQELVMALNRQGWSFYRLGDLPQALTVGEEARRRGSALGSSLALGHALNLLSSVHDLLGHHEQAEPLLHEALAIFRAAGDREREGAMLNNLGASAWMRGDCEAAVTFYEESLAVARELGMRTSEMLCLSNLGGARLGLGDFQRAEWDLRQALQMAEFLGPQVFLSESHRFLAEAYLGQGHIEAAGEAARHALALAQQSGVAEFEGAAWRALGMVGTARGGAPAPHAPRHCFEESARIFEAMGAQGETGRTLREAARYELLHGDVATGRQLWQQALALFQRLQLAHELAHSQQLAAAAPLAPLLADEG